MVSICKLVSGDSIDSLFNSMQSPAHRALFNDDLLRVLLAALSPGDPSLLERSSGGDLRRRTLKNLACVCKSFTGPALDVLWEELPSWEPLIPLLSVVLANLRNNEWMMLSVCLH